MRHEKFHFGPDALAQSLSSRPVVGTAAAGPVAVDDDGLDGEPAPEPVFIQQHFFFCGRAPRKDR